MSSTNYWVQNSPVHDVKYLVIYILDSNRIKFFPCFWDELNDWSWSTITFFRFQSPKSNHGDEQPNKKWQKEAPVVALVVCSAEIRVNGIQFPWWPCYVYVWWWWWRRWWGTVNCWWWWWFLRWWRWWRRWRNRRWWWWRRGVATWCALFISAVYGRHRGLIKFPWFNGSDVKKHKDQIQNHYWYLDFVSFNEHGGGCFNGSEYFTSNIAEF